MFDRELRRIDMSIRWKLNFSVLALIGVLLAAMLFSTHAVTENARQTRAFARTRELSQFTADIRTGVYQHLLLPADGFSDGGALREAWIRQAMEGMDIQTRLAETGKERALWQKVKDAVGELETATSNTDHGSVPEIVSRTEHDLRELRSYYDLAQYNSIAATANSSMLAQTATTVAWLLMVLLFLIHLAMVRRWLLVPIQVLRASVEIIGQGRLDYRVPLAGSDELGQLAQGIDSMADGLARYQADLVKTRQLSALGELCANVAHGLRNPLAAIRSTAQLAERRAEASGELQSVFRDLAHEADRMDRRITRLFEFSRPQELQPRATTFMELAAAAKAQATPLARTRCVRIEIDDRTGGASWALDCEQLMHALSEIMTNAIHHSRPNSELLVRGSATSLPPLAPMEMHSVANPAALGCGSLEELRAPCLEVQVIDSGAGMSPSTLAKAFDLFFSTRPDGSGMGLTLVRRLVERHCGTINLVSEPGKGTTCTIRLNVPLVEIPAKACSSGGVHSNHCEEPALVLG